MSIMGLTIDYGPYGFMEMYDPQYVPNGSDGTARYCYEKQPEICKWNLQKFAEALDPVLTYSQSMQIVEEEFDAEYTRDYNRLLGEKLGISFSPGTVTSLFETMESTYADFSDVFQACTMFVESLASSSSPSDESNAQSVLVARLVSRSASPASVKDYLKRKIRIHRVSMHPQRILQIWDILEKNRSE